FPDLHFHSRTILPMALGSDPSAVRADEGGAHIVLRADSERTSRGSAMNHQGTIAIEWQDRHSAVGAEVGPLNAIGRLVGHPFGRPDAQPPYGADGWLEGPTQHPRP